VLGYIGQFFGNLIKAAVSRQREFLADASAVQFTRNPEGISGALKRIGGYAPGSIVKNRNSEEVSHAFFAQGVKVMLGGLLSTHPRLDERIKRIDPRWDGEYLQRTAISTEPQAEDLAASVSGFDADQALRDIGNPGPSQLNVARNIIHSMPAGLTEAAHEPYSARAVTYLVLLATDPLVRGRQLEQLARSADATVFARVRQLLPTADTLSAEMRLPLLEMVMPALRQLTTDQYRQFRQNIDALIAADQKITLSEWALGKYIRHHLEEAFEGRKGRNRFSRYSQVKRECAIVFSVLALSDTRSSDSRAGFDHARRLLDIEIALVDKGELRLSVIDEAIDKLRDLAPLKKPKLLKACVAIITADKVVSPVEAELVRAIADSLDCPMPPLLSSFTSSE
ncbi:MAG: M48 family metalloprotease, partial [Pseudomonadales bacterium]